MSEVFYASRWTTGNRLFPTELEITDTAIIRRKRTWVSYEEETINFYRVASVRIQTGPMWSTIVIESTGGTDSIVCTGHHKDDALLIKQMIDEATENPPVTHHHHNDSEEREGDMKTCHWCAELCREPYLVRTRNHKLSIYRPEVPVPA